MRVWERGGSLEKRQVLVDKTKSTWSSWRDRGREERARQVDNRITIGIKRCSSSITLYIKNQNKQKQKQKNTAIATIDTPYTGLNGQKKEKRKRNLSGKRKRNKTGNLQKSRETRWRVQNIQKNKYDREYKHLEKRSKG